MPTFRYIPFLALCLSPLVIACNTSSDGADDGDAGTTDFDASDNDASDADTPDADASDIDASDTDASDTDASDADTPDADASDADTSDGDPAPRTCQDVLTDYWIGGACGSCMETNCCQEVVACGNDPGCMDCVTEQGEEGCEEGAAAIELLTCVTTSCEAECFDPPEPDFTPACDAPVELPAAGACGDGFQCNPVTNEGCGVDAACDLSVNNSFVCFGGQNTELLCTACDQANGPWCTPGHLCASGQCVRYCCEDSDCGSGVCDKSMLGLDVGLCKAAP